MTEGTTIGRAVCANPDCQLPIRHIQPEYAAEAIWVHDATMDKWCPSNPIAVPAPGTHQPVAQ